MAIQLIDGGYQLRDSNRLYEVYGIDELLQNAFLALRARRFRFYPDKNFGSRIGSIYQAQREPLADYITACAGEALDGLDGVYAVRTVVTDGEAVITLLLNGKERQVNLDLNDYL